MKLLKALAIIIIPTAAFCISIAGSARAAQAMRTVAVFTHTKGLPDADSSLTQGIAEIISFKIEAMPSLGLVPKSDYSLLQESVNTGLLWDKNSAEAARAAGALRADVLVVGRCRNAGGGKIEAEFRFYFAANSKDRFQAVKQTLPAGDTRALLKKLTAAVLVKLVPGTKAADSMPFTSSAAALRSFGNGVSLVDRGRADDGLKSLNEALRLEPSCRDFLYYAGKYYVTEKSDYEKSISNLGRITSSNQNDAGAHFWLGFTYFLKGDTGQSIREFESTTRIKPMQPEAYSYLALLYKDRGMLDKVETYYIKALDLVPGNAALWFNLAAAQSVMGKHEASIASLKKVLALDCLTYLPIMKTDRDFTNVLRTPDFQKLVKDYSQKCAK